MTQMSPTPMVRRGGSAGSNIYTVLALVAFLVLAGGVTYVAIRSGQLFGTAHPFQIVEAPRGGR